MRIEIPATKEQLPEIGIALTRGECREFIDSLEALLTGHGHEHVPSVDFQKEVTIWIEDATNDQ